jgi:uncharacterized membrane protein YjfL (UPF0719 family)
MDKVLDMLLDYLKVIGWSLVGALCMSVSLGILLKVYDIMTPINEWEEIRKGNIACAIIMAAVVLSFGIVIGLIVASPDTGHLVAR